MNEPLFRVENLRKAYSGRAGVEALRGATLDIARGACTALAGRNGAGKSTLALCVAGIEEPAGGAIWRLGQQVWPGPWFTWPGVQLIRQDSPLAFNPRWLAKDIIAEPLTFQDEGPEKIGAEVERLAAFVGLENGCLSRRPAELSGGQRQRIGLARALAVNGLELLIADEPLRGLDDESAISLLHRLRVAQLTQRFAMLYITHSLAEIRLVADHVAIMAEGRVVESARRDEFFANPKHSESRLIVESES